MASSLPLPSLTSPSRRISNIIAPAHCPDPAVIFHEGFYYAVRSKIEASDQNLDPDGWNCWAAAQDQVIILRSSRLEDVYTNPDASSVIINRLNPMGGTWGGVSVGAFQISYKQGDPCPSAGFWAPSLKRIDGHWFLFITGHRPDVNGEANFVVESADADPMVVGSWEYRGMLGHAMPGLDGEPIVLPTDDEFGTAVVLEENGRTVTGNLYYVYSHNDATQQFTQVLNLVRLVPDDSSFVEYDQDQKRNITFHNKWRAAGAGEATISIPMFDWEQQKCTNCIFNVNEGPTALYGPRNKTFVLFSASFCATKYYSIGMLEFAGTGTGFPFLWVKHSKPVFSGDVFSDDAGSTLLGVREDAFGIGHNSITVSPDYSESYIVYHAKSVQQEGPADRETRVQRFFWDENGRPSFGQGGPLGRGKLMKAPSEMQNYAFLCSGKGFQGRFCVGLPPGRYEKLELVNRGVFFGSPSANGEESGVKSIKFVGSIGEIRFYSAEAGISQPIYSSTTDIPDFNVGASGEIAAVEVLPAPSTVRMATEETAASSF